MSLDFKIDPELIALAGLAALNLSSTNCSSLPPMANEVERLATESSICGKLTYPKKGDFTGDQVSNLITACAANIENVEQAFLAYEDTCDRGPEDVPFECASGGKQYVHNCQKLAEDMAEFTRKLNPTYAPLTPDEIRANNEEVRKKVKSTYFPTDDTVCTITQNPYYKP